MFNLAKAFSRRTNHQAPAGDGLEFTGGYGVVY